MIQRRSQMKCAILCCNIKFPSSLLVHEQQLLPKFFLVIYPDLIPFTMLGKISRNFGCYARTLWE